MEFEAVVRGEDYRFSFLNHTSVLVTSKKGEYILYKNKTWRCADELSSDIVRELGDIIEERIRVPQR
jgi:hypothetical protein